MIKSIFIYQLILLPMLVDCQSAGVKAVSYYSPTEEDDSLLWTTSINYINAFNKPDTAAVNRILPEDFILQWMHENFVGKKNLLKVMVDSSIWTTMKYQIDRSEKTIIRYSDDHTAASLNTSFEFLDETVAASVKKQHGYGLCILYFQKSNGSWRLKTIHFDLHCSLCN